MSYTMSIKRKIKVSRVGDIETERPIRISIASGKRESVIFLDDMDASRLAEVLREAHHASRAGWFGEFEERE